MIERYQWPMKNAMFRRFTQLLGVKSTLRMHLVRQMKNPITVALIALLCGGITFVSAFYWKKGEVDDHHAQLTSFEWFCKEFEITSEQRLRIEKLHTDYFPECEDHCVHYADTRYTLIEITGESGLNNSPKQRDLEARLNQLEKEADKRFIDFVYKVAAEMDPMQSERYLRRMKGWLPSASDRHGRRGAISYE